MRIECVIDYSQDTISSVNTDQTDLHKSTTKKSI